MKTNILKKSLALALAAVTFGLPLLTNEALAASHHDRHDHRVERRVDNRHHHPKVHRSSDRYEHRVVRHRHPAPPPRTHKRHSNNDKLVGGLVIGAILGAVIANNAK